MGPESELEVGTIGWTDLTVEDAERIRDFYARVVGWSPSPVAMEGYDDFNMNTPSGGQPTAGICHARGPNADLPPQWMIYIVVEDVDRSVARCTELGGRVVTGPRGSASTGRTCVIQDPAGAVAALYQPPRGA